jgi:hypothetical protein
MSNPSYTKYYFTSTAQSVGFDSFTQENRLSLTMPSSGTIEQAVGGGTEDRMFFGTEVDHPSVSSIQIPDPYDEAYEVSVDIVQVPTDGYTALAWIYVFSADGDTRIGRGSIAGINYGTGVMVESTPYLESPEWGSTDADTRIGVEYTASAAAMTPGTSIISLGADSYIDVPVEEEGAPGPTTETGSLTADAIIQKAQSGDFTADAIIQKAQSGSLTADAFIQPFFVVDAVIDNGAALIYGRPDADIVITGWSTAPLFSKVDDDPDDPDGVTVTASV